ncbi:hypothetical protein EMIHUDRAFT_250355 [Emiliania huxleyi CCMP1516]|uniref:Uncharacterized protein n=2 Tax=Emiliania huxleyi TaxID=2903 RepID=A0A0D3I101_EMIH1|nr:hypothetical protein EMIHUDRAFT_250355 [Emiliania huxleyi CCMP1516]EOD04936.1 hypothetical protein EMIHUDRAFT_250355 [Emiliania huxleyi CCMP1516]|eukprot:XP_005757365.1 hypothetical protein EMIHUDRAFT_250355 [Emiliania huxleyi CCMP1516]
MWLEKRGPPPLQRWRRRRFSMEGSCLRYAQGDREKIMASEDELAALTAAIDAALAHEAEALPKECRAVAEHPPEAAKAEGADAAQDAGAASVDAAAMITAADEVAVGGDGSELAWSEAPALAEAATPEAVEGAPPQADLAVAASAVGEEPTKEEEAGTVSEPSRNLPGEGMPPAVEMAEAASPAPPDCKVGFDDLEVGLCT